MREADPFVLTSFSILAPALRKWGGFPLGFML